VPDHGAKLATKEMVENADIILTMERRHKENLIQRYPSAASKVFTCGEWIGLSAVQDIPDPYGGNMQIYMQTALLLKEILKLGIEKLEKEVQMDENCNSK